jgi:hypothetical protein
MPNILQGWYARTNLTVEVQTIVRVRGRKLCSRIIGIAERE